MSKTLAVSGENKSRLKENKKKKAEITGYLVVAPIKLNETSTTLFFFSQRNLPFSFKLKITLSVFHDFIKRSLYKYGILKQKIDWIKSL